MLLLFCCVHIEAFQSPQPRRLSFVGAAAAPRKAVEFDSEFISQVDELWQTSPYMAGALVCGVKASAADFVAQSNEHHDDDDLVRSEQPDYLRNLSFIIYGRALYQGMAHEYCFNHLYPLWFGTGTDLACVGCFQSSYSNNLGDAANSLRNSSNDKERGTRHGL